MRPEWRHRLQLARRRFAPVTTVRDATPNPPRQQGFGPGPGGTDLFLSQRSPVDALPTPARCLPSRRTRQASKKPAFSHSRKRWSNPRCRTVRRAKFHWQPVRSTNTMASKTTRAGFLVCAHRRACGRRFSPVAQSGGILRPPPPATHPLITDKFPTTWPSHTSVHPPRLKAALSRTSGSSGATGLFVGAGAGANRLPRALQPSTPGADAPDHRLMRPRLPRRFVGAGHQAEHASSCCPMPVGVAPDAAVPHRPPRPAELAVFPPGRHLVTPQKPPCWCTSSLPNRREALSGGRRHARPKNHPPASPTAGSRTSWPCRNQRPRSETVYPGATCSEHENAALSSN